MKGKMNIGAAVAGHSKTTTTMNRYAHARRDAAKRASMPWMMPTFCDKICDTPFSTTYYRRGNPQNTRFVIHFVIKRHEKSREVIKMTAAGCKRCIFDP
ncbi:MAG: hypothetical protein E7316_03125 [Clostridiales bacterium]|nr:hypothetical protein [Clostridiales bacterium]